MSKYDFTSYRLLSLVPTVLRKPIMVKILQCLLNPVSCLYMMFTSFREKKEYRLSHTGQVFSLSQVVCDFCGNNECYITDGEYIDEVIIPYADKGELANYQTEIPVDDSITPAVMVPYIGMMQTQQNDFVVHLPQDLQDTIDEGALCALIDEYKLAGKMYSIVYDDENDR